MTTTPDVSAPDDPPDPGAFPLVGEALAIDLVNTEVVVRGKGRDLLATQADLAAWWRAARGHYPSAGLADERRLGGAEGAFHGAARELRRALRAILSALIDREPVPGDDLAVVNRVLRSGYAAVAIEPDGRPRLDLASHASGSDALLLPIARSAADLLTGRDLTRLHCCGNERCVLFFYDTTRSGTRRWCSTACMQRDRSRRRYRERKAEDGGRRTEGGKREEMQRER